MGRDHAVIPAHTVAWTKETRAGLPPAREVVRIPYRQTWKSDHRTPPLIFLRLRCCCRDHSFFFVMPHYLWHSVQPVGGGGGGGDSSATALMAGRIASPEMLPSVGLLPHVICSPPGFGGGEHEADQHGDTG